MIPTASAKAPIVVTGPEDVVTRHISYADLNLVSPAGERTLNLRVRAGVRSLCSEATRADNSAWQSSENAKCENLAFGEARPQIGRAVQRARDLAFTGTSSLGAEAIMIALPE